MMGRNVGTNAVDAHLADGIGESRELLAKGGDFIRPEGAQHISPGQSEAANAA